MLISEMIEQLQYAMDTHGDGVVNLPEGSEVFHIKYMEDKFYTCFELRID